MTRCILGSNGFPERVRVRVRGIIKSGSCPLHPRNNPIPQIIQSSILIRIHTTANAPHVEGAGLTEVVHVANEVHEPREGRIDRIRRRRPIAGRLDVAKRMAGRQSRIRLGGIHQARQLVDGGESPALAATDRSRAQESSVRPGEYDGSWRLLPHEPCLIVPDGGVPHHAGKSAGSGRARTAGIVRRPRTRRGVVRTHYGSGRPSVTLVDSNA